MTATSYAAFNAQDPFFDVVMEGMEGLRDHAHCDDKPEEGICPPLKLLAAATGERCGVRRT